MKVRKTQFTILSRRGERLPIPRHDTMQGLQEKRNETENKEKGIVPRGPSDCWVCLVITSITYLLLAMSDIDCMPISHHDIAQSNCQWMINYPKKIVWTDITIARFSIFDLSTDSRFTGVLTWLRCEDTCTYKETGSLAPSTSWLDSYRNCVSKIREESPFS